MFGDRARARVVTTQPLFNAQVEQKDMPKRQFKSFAIIEVQ